MISDHCSCLPACWIWLPDKSRLWRLETRFVQHQTSSRQSLRCEKITFRWISIEKRLKTLKLKLFFSQICFLFTFWGTICSLVFIIGSFVYLPHKTLFPVHSLIATFFCSVSILISPFLLPKSKCARWISTFSLLYIFFASRAQIPGEHSFALWNLIYIVEPTLNYNILHLALWPIRFYVQFLSSFIFRSFPTPYVLRHSDKTRIHNSNSFIILWTHKAKLVNLLLGCELVWEATGKPSPTVMLELLHVGALSHIKCNEIPQILLNEIWIEFCKRMRVVKCVISFFFSNPSSFVWCSGVRVENEITCTRLHYSALCRLLLLPSKIL